MGFVCFVQFGSIGIFIQLHYRNHINHSQVETVETVGDIIYCLSEMCRKRQLVRINHSDTEDLSYWWCTYKRILHKNSVRLFGRIRLCIVNQQLVLSKVILCMELQVLINLDSH